ncbi:hypothetical protein [Sinosporangium siamense]|uniref:Uncharacterized protein n=1 Tax=Sinosporangium siamense TaxID=1367973 RepID=A0A919RAL4_9ACTN|nr:hypothetical protein [Sinosporangium siamense]GII90430.1 hypothetical protein Ssi02_06610 [Sinosporangium siamense]
MDSHEDGAPVSVAESLRLIEREQAQARRRLVPNLALVYIMWGVAWLVGYGLLFLRFGPGGQVLVPMPAFLPLATLGVLGAAAVVATAVTGCRGSRAVAGPSRVQGAMYGWSWALGFLVLMVLGAKVTPFMPPEYVQLFYAAGSGAVVGLLYSVGGAVFQERYLFMLGVWIIVTDVLGILAGPGWHSLVTALASGLGMILFGLIAWRRQRC